MTVQVLLRSAVQRRQDVSMTHSNAGTDSVFHGTLFVTKTRTATTDLMKKAVDLMDHVLRKPSNAMMVLVCPERVSATDDGNVLMAVTKLVVTKESPVTPRVSDAKVDNACLSIPSVMQSPTALTAVMKRKPLVKAMLKSVLKEPSNVRITSAGQLPFYAQESMAVATTVTKTDVKSASATNP